VKSSEIVCQKIVYNILCNSILLARNMPSPVRLSVRRVDQSKMVEVRIMKFLQYGSPIPLLYVG